MTIVKTQWQHASVFTEAGCLGGELCGFLLRFFILFLEFHTF